MKVFLTSYGCNTAAGNGVGALWEGLSQGRTFRDEKTGVCRWPENVGANSRERLAFHLRRAWAEAGGDSLAGPELGVILSSTKGYLEDSVWGPPPKTDSDTLAPVLADFLADHRLAPRRSIAVSNACASSHAAVLLASHWLKAGLVQRVVILAVDEVGPFIEKGFRALGALSPTRVKPFAEDRDGLQLGEAAAVLVLDTVGPGPEIAAVAVETEGQSVTRPSTGGEGLRRVCEKALGDTRPDLIVAHGTATKLNDAAEAAVFAAFAEREPAITCTKWSVGHTLGASGAVDLIAAAEMLKREVAFGIASTPTSAPEFRGNYLHENLAREYRRALVTSLGFGGVHGALVLSKGPV